MAQDRPESRSVSLLARFNESFRQQEMVFATLNLFVLAALLLLHSLFSSLLGEPSPVLLVTLGAAFLFKMLELLWLWGRSDAEPNPRGRRRLGFDFPEYRFKPFSNISHQSGRQSILYSPGLACIAGSLPIQPSRLHRCDCGCGFRDLLLGRAFCGVSSASPCQRVL